MKTKSLEVEITEEQILAWLLDKGMLPHGDEDSWTVEEVFPLGSLEDLPPRWTIALAIRESAQEGVARRALRRREP